MTNEYHEWFCFWLASHTNELLIVILNDSVTELLIKWLLDWLTRSLFQCNLHWITKLLKWLQTQALPLQAQGEPSLYRLKVRKHNIFQLQASSVFLGQKPAELWKAKELTQDIHTITQQNTFTNLTYSISNYLFKTKLGKNNKITKIEQTRYKTKDHD